MVCSDWPPQLRGGDRRAGTWRTDCPRQRPRRRGDRRGNTIRHATRAAWWRGRRAGAASVGASVGADAGPNHPGAGHGRRGGRGPPGSGGCRSHEDGERASSAARGYRHRRPGGRGRAGRGERRTDRDRVKKLFSHPLTQKTRRIVRRVMATCAVIIAVAFVTTITVDLGPALKGQAERAATSYMGRPMHIGRLGVHLWLGRFVLEDIVIEGLKPEDRPFL